MTTRPDTVPAAIERWQPWPTTVGGLSSQLAAAYAERDDLTTRHGRTLEALEQLRHLVRGAAADLLNRHILTAPQVTVRLRRMGLPHGPATYRHTARVPATVTVQARDPAAAVRHARRVIAEDLARLRVHTALPLAIMVAACCDKASWNTARAALADDLRRLRVVRADPDAVTPWHDDDPEEDDRVCDERPDIHDLDPTAGPDHADQFEAGDLLDYREHDYDDDSEDDEPGD